MISEQAENILNYLKTKLAPVAPLAEVMLSDLCEIVSYGMYFASLDGAAKEKADGSNVCRESDGFM